MDRKKISKALKDIGYASGIKEIRKGRKFNTLITETGTKFYLGNGWLREYPSKRMLKKIK